MIRGLGLDLEGTVVDVEKAHHKGHLAAAADAGVPLTMDEALQRLPHFIGGPDIAIVTEIWQISDKRMSFEEIKKSDEKYYWEFLQGMEIAPRPGFREFLAEARQLGLQLSIGSLTPTNQAQVLLDRSGLRNMIGELNIVLAEDVEWLKPAPDVYIETARRMGINPNDQLVFEDSSRGVQAAIAAGSRAIGMPVYNRVEATVPLLQAGALRLFMDWREVALEALLCSLNQGT